MRKIPEGYKVGDKIIDGLVAELAKKCSYDRNEPVLYEILTTAVKLGLESRDLGDLRLVNNALKELRYSFKIFSPYRNVKKVIIFGSARTKKTAVEYRMAEEFARKLTERGYMIVTGGGPGIMEAGNKGAKPGKEFGLNIRLPFEQKPNPYINEKEKIINFKYFFTRKLIFIKETDATALFPGGFGTHDEGFEMLTLVQTGKSKPRPIVYIAPRTSNYWRVWSRFVKRELLSGGFIDKDDLNLFRIFTNVDDAVDYIENFYRVYHSIRYISGLTVIRLNRKVSDRTINILNRKFKDILKSGEIKLGPPLKKEIDRGEYPDLPRIIMNFNMHDYGRLYKLIGVINND